MKKILVSTAVSLLTLGLLFHLVSQGTEQEAALWPLLRDAAQLLTAGYILCQVTQTFCRSERYRILLRGAGEERIPGPGRSFLATLARNAMVDALPARAGELGYLALMNLNYRVGADTCLGSMAISFLFDMVALAVVLAMAMASPWSRGLPAWPVIASGAATLAIVCLLGLWGLFTLLPRWIIPLWGRLSARVRGRRTGRAAAFISDTLRATAAVRDSRLLLLAFVLSLGVRFFKYAGLFMLFRGVTRLHLPEMAAAEARHVLPALLAGEGAAALPLPALMGFGAYEGGATGIWTLLGYPAASALLAMLAVHIVSQAVDYTLGGTAFAVIALQRRPRTAAPAIPPPRRRRLARCAVAALMAAALLFTAFQWRALRKRGSLNPPSEGVALAAAPAVLAARDKLIGDLHGHMVWSSNRHGNHDILLMELPSGKTRRLTTHAYTETYPRLSPDGTQVLFSRAHTPWVSQRNSAPWDAWITAIATGHERRVATNAFFAAWADEGRAIVFQRDRDREVVLLKLADGTERLLLRSGQTPIPDGASLQTPDYRAATGATAITLRGARRVTGWVAADGTFTTIGAGDTCQLTWIADDALALIGQGGHMKNFIGRHSLLSGKTERWLDLPGEFSHEYFPRLSPCGRILVFGASAGGHEHDTADYEIFAWKPGTPPESAARLTFHTGNDSWPDVWLAP